MDLKPITLEDKPVIDSFLEEWQFDSSEYCFTNMFIWRNCWNVKYAVEDDVLYLWARYQNNKPVFYVPVTRHVSDDLCHPMKNAYHYALENGCNLRVRCITDRMKEIIEKTCEKKLVFTSNPNVEDYVYNTSDLIDLPGKKYHSKRNHINKFLSTYQYEYVPLTKEIVPECIAFYEEWASKRETDSNLDDERTALKEALTHMEELKLKGGVIKIAGKVEAFTVGEMINKKTAIIHIEKANDEVNGLYTFINQQFAQREWSHTQFINREEDMGIAGLRKAKQSYYPVKMVKKYEAVLADAFKED